MLFPRPQRGDHFKLLCLPTVTWEESRSLDPNLTKFSYTSFSASPTHCTQTEQTLSLILTVFFVMFLYVLIMLFSVEVDGLMTTAALLLRAGCNCCGPGVFVSKVNIINHCFSPLLSATDPPLLENQTDHSIIVKYKWKLHENCSVSLLFSGPLIGFCLCVFVPFIVLFVASLQLYVTQNNGSFLIQ